ncbi:spore coat protein U domain-containing protein [Alteraurantiacibacter buctensis]|uniref:Fimbrial major subunit CsuA/B family protein n=1 Tax=Alteraurantiacibacter buctensis TaxID=1503981 RepID=A0A844YUS2_9SPHN|nr:spore coat protein U domain-containing protein [Alteraurantiacibacter buctensis]MXO70618.1 fimbrial major subunit CsuA/B family protein [Alteraurantiacibacter buctensis]
MKGLTLSVALLLRLCALLMAAPVISAVAPGEAKAGAVCSVVNSGLAFGSGSTATGTVNWTCTGYDTFTNSFVLCLRLGTPSWPGTASQPQLLNGSSTMAFNLYSNAATTTIWTASTPLTQSVTIGAGIGNTVTGSFSFYGRIPAAQSSPAGNYQAFFYNTLLGIANNGGNNCQASRQGNSGLDFTLPVTATKINACTVDALANASLGSVVAGSTPAPGSTTIRVVCPTGTAYNIGLLPSNGNMGGAGMMQGTGSNTDTVGYQLRRNSGSGAAWGNTATVTSVGNGVGGTGTGGNQDYAVFASVPNTNVQPDSYSDTVTVTVNY